MTSAAKPFVAIGEAAASFVERLEQQHREKDNPMSPDSGRPRAHRGFAAMSPEKRREIARKGGASVPDHKRSFAKDRDLAATAGRLGGEAPHRSRGHRPASRIAAE